MVERDERELLLASLKGHLEGLRESGLEELVLEESGQAAGGDNAPVGESAEDPMLTGTGDPQAGLLFVLTGAGLAGTSGDLFARIIKAMGFEPGEVYLLSFPERSSESARVLRAALLERIRAVAPKVVVALGERAAQMLLQSGEPLSSLRGRFRDLEGTPLMATLHPDQILADESLKREVWQEMKQVMGRL